MIDINFEAERQKHAELIKRVKIEKAKTELYNTIIDKLRKGDMTEDEVLLYWSDNKDNIEITVKEVN